MKNFIPAAKLLFVMGVGLLVAVNTARAECSADNQATYDSCIDAAAVTCAASLTECDSTTLRTTNSAALVNKVVDKCCAKSKQRAQLSCASVQIARLSLTRLVIPSNPYSEFRQSASAAIKELRALRKNKTLCDTGSN